MQEIEDKIKTLESILGNPKERIKFISNNNAILELQEGDTKYHCEINEDKIQIHKLIDDSLVGFIIYYKGNEAYVCTGMRNIYQKVKESFEEYALSNKKEQTNKHF